MASHHAVPVQRRSGAVQPHVSHPHRRVVDPRLDLPCGENSHIKDGHQVNGDGDIACTRYTPYVPVRLRPWQP